MENRFGGDYSIDEVNVILDEIAELLPQAFFKGLSGGISLIDDVKYHPEGVGNDLYIMGEYHRGNFGRYIYIYYGSFMKLYGSLDRDALKEKLRGTLVHEFTHHLEHLAGENGLEIEDSNFIRTYRETHGL